nr:biosynthetic peptidoglycan transglycosylase [uncultured bacterium]
MFGFGTRSAKNRSFAQRWKGRLLKLLLTLLFLPWLLVLVMRWINPPVTAFMIETKIGLYAEHAPKTRLHHDWVQYRDIAPAMKLAVISSEDQRFAEHHGFDWEAIYRAHTHNLLSRRVRGASTISQQVAKNLFLWGDRSWLRKAVEAYLTVLIEMFWSKQRILEVYLNIAQFDQRIFGVGAAAKLLMHTTPARLSASQAALLAGVLPSPEKLHADAPSPYLRSRQYQIEHQIEKLGPQYLQQVEHPQ